MHRPVLRQDLPRAQLLAERALATFERFTHVQAASGVVLLIAAAIALLWANSSFAPHYHALWHTPISFGVGHISFSQSLHFWINDALMTVFFLVVGMEVRREIHEGSLRDLRQASLPIAAAAGGVILPALVYLSLNNDAIRQHGWAVPTATDIAFAVGLLALLGRSIPANVRVFLLALAIIDDIVAVLIIALFYSGGLDYSGFAIAGLGLLMVIGLQRLGIGTAYAYILPGAVLWVGLLKTGAHPTLAGVVLGLMTPVIPVRMRERPLDKLARIVGELTSRGSSASADLEHMNLHLRELRLAQRELLPPVVRLQSALHPWVAFGIMPLFALANAGVSLDGVDLALGGAHWVTTGIMFALVIGKPIGIVGGSWLLVRLGWCALPPGVSWGGIWLIGLFAGVGFTMSMFIAMLAFTDDNLLGAAKLGVLLGSVAAAALGMVWGVIYARRLRNAGDNVPAAGAPAAAALSAHSS
ncbi:Na+/H+ antiporter NhaA [Pseudomonas saudimassiliensis]|uniref:Na(+)/H(+) antiporter NhaA n=1 Tax=Pseudomonas saudimassiliensis TaxID=1461581 RepID=A0A078MGT5_9PSED|nr:Na+/H+ antiporter NhaA [Pseudomonas saudimassiliensis]CEA03896.1 Na+/H+ antiporter NhaA [Pseudomonas saudimassiliensis]CEF26341.1 Na+/H+ antiporter NhaA [Pseudomonas saudimassiliensis]